MTSPTAHVPTPALEWRDDTPVSAAFGDVYFSRAGGVAETEHVFLAGNGLPERWRECSQFTIAELGFGTGLNFLVALKRFREAAPAHATLHYIAIEKFPFTADRLSDVLTLQPALAKEAKELLAAYPLRLPGIHRIHLSGCVLTLCFGDVAEMLEEISGGGMGVRSASREPLAAGVSPKGVGGKTPFNYICIDAWFLDGFSPAKNPEMWTQEVLASIGRLSGAGTSVATFTAAGEVRRGLQSVGFEVSKVQGFGHKRDMLVGRRAHSAPDNAAVSGAVPPAHVIVIGAGIAGATLAHALALRGQQVTVLERGSIAQGASGNAAGVLFPQLTKQWNSSTAWYFTAYGYVLRQLAVWKAQGLAFPMQTMGMLRLPRHAEEEEQLRALNESLGLDSSIVHWLDREEASAIAGMTLPTGAAYFPQGTWISPPELCRVLMQHPAITLREQTAAISLVRADRKWSVTLANGESLKADYVAVASAHESALLLTEYGLRLNAVGGQVSEIAAQTEETMLRSILCHKGYMIPCSDRYLIGATYHRDDMMAVTMERHHENIAELTALLSQWNQGEILGGRSSIRATTPDRMPYIGALDEGLYVSTGHGSRGLLSAPLGAEMIASHMSGEILPVTSHLARAVHPLRFAKR